MKKILLRIGIALLALLILVVLAISLFLDGAIKRGVETIGPKLTKVDIKLDNVNLSLLSGSGTIKGLVVGNPEGFKTPNAISVGRASLSLKPGSLFSDKIVIRSINVEAPEITFEGGLGGSNLGKILDNVKAATGGGGKAGAAQPAEEQPGKKLEVDEFIIRNAKVHGSLKGLGGETVTVALPDIHLTDLGTGPEGITAGELTERVLAEIERGAAKAVAGGMNNLGKSAESLTKDIGKSVGSNANSISKSVGDLFKKK